MANGREGLKAAFCELPQLIIMDVMKEEMDGLTVVRELKKIRATKHIPIIVITGNVKAHDAFRQECAIFGVAVFLSKSLRRADSISKASVISGLRRRTLLQTSLLLRLDRGSGC